MQLSGMPMQPMNYYPRGSSVLTDSILLASKVFSHVLRVTVSPYACPVVFAHIACYEAMPRSDLYCAT